jgi:hypothetical protein
MSDPQRLLVAELHGLAGRQQELRALLDELAEGAHGEPGCVSFRVLAATSSSITSPRRFVRSTPTRRTLATSTEPQRRESTTTGICRSVLVW